jgi:CHAT domain-containing protein
LEEFAHNTGNKPKFITIIPDGMLSHLPFDALIQKLPESNTCTFKDLDYLIIEYEISYSFSSNFLAFSEKMKENNKIKNILAFGYYAEEKEISDGNQRNTRHMSLSGTKTELDDIAKYYSGNFLIGSDASESNFKRLCTGYDAIHLAVHGTYDSLNNYNTYLIFNSTTDSLEDGKLYNYDLFPMKLNSSLAVLSACETGLGKNNPGEGLLSMGWGFAYAGCQSLVLSLWQATDQSTTNLMREFYKQLSTSHSITKSLREAKCYYLAQADEYTAHPKYWATFVNYGLPGSSRVLQFTHKVIYIILMAVVSLLFISFLFYKKLRHKLRNPIKHRDNHRKI